MAEENTAFGSNQIEGQTGTGIAGLKGTPFDLSKGNNSSGTTVKNSQQAKDNNSNTQSPESANKTTKSSPTNDKPLSPAGVQAPTSGRIASGATGQVQNNNNSTQKIPSDDQAKPTTTSVGSTGNKTKIPVEYLNQIIPTPNPLSSMVSYTYNISIYLMSPDDYRQVIFSAEHKIPPGLLLMRSGGAPAASGDTGSGATGLGGMQSTNTNATPDIGSRNQNFPLDFYIEDLQIQHAISGQATGSVHNVTEMEFTIVEPNGITFLNRLKDAVSQYYGPLAVNKKTGEQANVNYAAAQYLMVVRFYGYDQYGNLIHSLPEGDPGKAGVQPVIQKYIPFRLTEVGFRIKNRLTRYHCKAAAVPSKVGFSEAFGTIPYNIELSADTLKNLFLGPAVYKNDTAPETSTAGQTTPLNSGAQAIRQGNRATSGPTSTSPNFGKGLTTRFNPNPPIFGGPAKSTPAPAGSSDALGSKAPEKASAAPNKTVVSGLISALNEYEQTVKKKQGFIPNVYDVVFEEGSGLAEATLRKPGRFNKSDSPMVQVQTAADRELEKNQRVTKNQKNYSIVAGTQIVQFMDIAIRSSSYITDQQLFIFDEVTQKMVPSPNDNKTVMWYKILCQVEPLEYDVKRNDFAYKITYYIKRYQINDLKSNYFVRSEFRGTHKRYDYWFTGKNTEVLDYEANFDYLYFIQVTEQDDTSKYTKVSYQESNARELEMRYFSSASNESSRGGEGKATEPASNAASILYSPGAQGEVNFTILGDPDWFIQSELFYAPIGGQIGNSPFMPDGSVNPDASLVLFEINFNTPEDYNLTGSGLMEVGKNNYNRNEAKGQPGDARNSFVYRTAEIKSRFSGGKFTQNIRGALERWPTKQQVEEREAGEAANRERLLKQNSSASAKEAPPVRQLTKDEWNKAVSRENVGPRGRGAQQLTPVITTDPVSGQEVITAVPKTPANQPTVISDINRAATKTGNRGRGAPPLQVTVKDQ